MPSRCLCGDTYESTKRSLLAHCGFCGLNLMNWLKRMWAIGAMPIGAPGWPELALNVASTCSHGCCQWLS